MSLAYQNPVKRVPCPFCGKADVTIGCEGSTYYVYCCGCRVQGRWANSIEEAEQAWATRPIESAAQADKHAALKELAREVLLRMPYAQLLCTCRICQQRPALIEKLNALIAGPV